MDASRPFSRQAILRPKGGGMLLFCWTPSRPCYCASNKIDTQCLASNPCTVWLLPSAALTLDHPSLFSAELQQKGSTSVHQTHAVPHHCPKPFAGPRFLALPSGVLLWQAWLLGPRWSQLKCLAVFLSREEAVYCFLSRHPEWCFRKMSEAIGCPFWWAPAPLPRVQGPCLSCPHQCSQRPNPAGLLRGHR